MEEFDFDFHLFSAEYPDSGDRLQLGRSYMFTAGPVAPDQRVITLHFPTMFYYVNAVTGTPDTTTNPKMNFLRLEGFYTRHRLWKPFNYRHPMYGMLVVKFDKPLKTPKGLGSGAPKGQLEGFTVDLLEQP